MKDFLVQIEGQRQVVEYQKTLSSGQATFDTGLKKWRPLGAPCLYHASAVPAETVGIAGTPDSDGWFHGNVVIDSSNGSSTATVMGQVWGY